MPSEKHPLPLDSSPPSTTKPAQSSNVSSARPASSATAKGAGPSSSGGARKKVIGASPRTGQACDRCKSRKIRCDDTPGGCLPCRQTNTECKTTDRITHRATARGHTETLERDVDSLREHIVQLEQQLRDAGREPSDSADYVPGSTPGHQWDPPTAGAFAWDPRPAFAGSNETSSGRKEVRSRGSSAAGVAASGHLSRTRLGSQIGENYSGVAFAEDLSPVKGLALTLFNMTIDLGDCMPQEDKNSPTWWMTYEAVSNSITGHPQSVDIAAQAKLPDTYAECMRFYGFWSTITHPCFPVLHKPDFEALIQRIYNGGIPTTAEDVCIHMMLAFMKYQDVMRNNLGSEFFDAKLTDVMAHVHYCLRKYGELMKNRTIHDLVAAVMICVVVRAFPRPGAAWSLMQCTMSAGIEMGFHRSHKAWTKEDIERSVLEIELRKRVFWTLYMCHTALSGKLGRPMILTREDYDIEFPEPLNDDLISADPGDEPHHCTFYIAIEYFKMTEIFVDIYSGIYTVRPPPGRYETTLRDLDWKMRKWKRELPPLLADTSSSETEHPTAARMFALWLKCWYSEMLLLVHHPGLCKSKAPDVIRHNIEVSGEAASQLIQTVRELWSHKAYDLTWYNTTTFFAAIFTRLFVVGEAVDRISFEDLEEVVRQNEGCLDVIGDIGDLLGPGTGARIRARMEKILGKGVDRIRQELVQRGKTPAGAGPSKRQSSAPSPASSLGSSNSSVRNATPLTSSSQAQRQDQRSHIPSPSGMYPPGTNSSVSQVSYPYSPSRSGAYVSPRPATQSSSRETVYSSPRSGAYPSPRPGAYPSPRPGAYPSPRYGPYPSPLPPQPLPSYYQMYPPQGHPYGVPHMAVHGQHPMHPDAFHFPLAAGHEYSGYNAQTAWRNWIETTSGAESQEYVPASALVALSGHEQATEHDHGLVYGGSMPSHPIPALVPDTNDNTVAAQQEWPGVTYDRPGYSVLPDGTLRRKN